MTAAKGFCFRGEILSISEKFRERYFHLGTKFMGEISFGNRGQAEMEKYFKEEYPEALKEKRIVLKNS